MVGRSSVAQSGGAAWGGITGTLGDQADLQTALDAKGDDADLALKAPLASPALTGNPTVPTQSVGNNSTRAASTAFVQAEFGARRYVAVFGNDADSSYTITHNLNAKVIAQVTTTADGAFPAAGVYTNHSSLNAIVVTLLSPPGVDALEIVVLA